MKITRLKITAYRGIEELETAIPAAGAIFSGGNARGKTTCLNAVKACLTSQEVSPDAVRIGSDKAEILIDLDDHTVKRAISRNAPSKVTVERDGMKASKPVTYLQELLGTSSLDPLDFYLADPPKRKAQILAAMPITVTLAQLKKFAPDLEDGFDVSGHGLAVVERARKFYYDERTLANKETKEAEATAKRLAAEVQALAAAVTPGPIVPSDRARESLALAERDLMALESRVTEAAKATERTEGQRAEIARLRARAAEMEPRFAGPPTDLSPLEQSSLAASNRVSALRAELATAERLAAEAVEAVQNAKTSNTVIVEAAKEIASIRAQADTLEAALAAAAVTAPSTSEIEKARSVVEVARATVDRAAAQATALAAVQAAAAAQTIHVTLEGEAAELDATVKRLANDAPSELLAGAKGIPGISVEGDDVLLDGKRLNALSGAEQMKLAVEIARRANAKSKILVVDGLERLDPDQMETFVALATADNWQLIGTRVSRGELVIEALKADAHDVAAE